MTRRHIAVLTGKRGGYGAMTPMLRAIESDPGLRLSLMVTDQHLDPRFGATIAEVERDFPVAAAVDMEQADGSPRARVEALGVCLHGIAAALAELAPDVLVLYGDRGEVLVTGIAALNLGIPIAHLQGGDVSGNADDSMRHALTKLSHLHFVSSEESAERVRRMGEEPWRVKVVGDSHVDPIVARAYTGEAEVRARFAVPEGERPIIVLQHPETTRRRDGRADMRATLDAVLSFERRTIVVYPCSDQGYDGIVAAIDEVAGRPGVSVHVNIDAPDFWGLMAIAGAMVGNSSAGLIETPYFRVPAVDLGARQAGRRRAENVIHCDFDRAAITAALERALGDPAFARRVADCSLPFGDGQAYRRIVEALKSVPLDQRLIEKRMAY